MTRILITGGAGFIGSRLAHSLAEKGHSVVVLDCLSPQVHGACAVPPPLLDHPNIDFIEGSVANRGDLERSLAGVDAIAHLAAETGTGQSMYEIERYNHVNTQATALLLDILAQQKARSVTRIVLSSSRSVYGEGKYRCEGCRSEAIYPHERPASALAAEQWDPACPACNAPLLRVATTEDAVLRPASIYAATKLAQEDLVRIACQSMNIGYAIFRLQNVYGEGQSLKNPYTGILSIFSTKIRMGAVLPLFEDGEESRDFVHVDDVIAALETGLLCADAPDTVMNVGSGVGTSVRAVATLLNSALEGRSDIVVTGEYRLGDIRHNVADIERLKIFLGRPPQIGLETGLARFAQWVRTQPLPEDRLDAANAELRARNLMR